MAWVTVILYLLLALVAAACAAFGAVRFLGTGALGQTVASLLAVTIVLVFVRLPWAREQFRRLEKSRPRTGPVIGE